MINITRTSKIPDSLQNPEIQSYLDALSDFKEGKISEKPDPPVSYRNSDVLEEFDKCFFSKCYLTEEKFATAYIMDIDHFVPKSEAPEKRYEWTNLFPAEHNANMARPRKMPGGGYLNPCEPSEDVEKAIFYDVGVFGNQPKFAAVNGDDVKAKNTAELLDKIHNGEKGKPSQEKTKHLRVNVKKRFDEIAMTIIKWQSAKLLTDSQSEFNLSNQLKSLLSRKASFTMLMRSTEIVRQCVPPDFLD